MLLAHYTKSLLRNKNLWGWGVLLMLFYLVLGAFVMSSNIPKNTETAMPYTASWYATTNLFTLASMAISIAYSIIYGTNALAYSFRYTRLTPASYLANLVASSMIVGATLSAIILGATYAIFYARFGPEVAPSNPALALGYAALSGLFMYVFATLLVLVLINHLGLKNQSFVSFVPLILSYLFGFMALYTSLPKTLLYVSPYTAIQDLLYHAYTGQPIPAKLTDPASGTLDPAYLLVSLAAWIVVLLAVDSAMLRTIRPRSLEEGRQI